MDTLHQLKGNWDYTNTILYMKAMFCWEAHYLEISDESMEFLNEVSRRGYPFARTNYEKIFTDFRIEFNQDPARFVQTCLSELKQCNWSAVNKLALIEPISLQIFSGYQLILLKVIGNYFFVNNEEVCAIEYNTEIFQIANSANIDYFASHILLPEGDVLDPTKLSHEFQQWSRQWLDSGTHMVNLFTEKVIA